VNLKSKEPNSLSSEEIANSWIHAIGVILCIAGAIALLIKAYDSHDLWQIYSAYIYCGSLLLLYLASTLYHAFSNPKLKEFFHVIDHSAIYVLIAGTYTPFLLVGLRNEIHYSFIMIMWGIALFGIIYKVFMIKKFKLISTLIYLGMGWMAVIKLDTFYHHLSVQASIWILIGGLFYSVGTIFYSKKNLWHHHAIWHIFVLFGSICHYIAIYFFVY
jgi:hemolysin III